MNDEELDLVDAFTVGTVGRPGQRVFYLQARTGRRQITVRCEKQQVAAMVEHLRKVLNDLPPADERPMPGSLGLLEPIDTAFVLGTIGLGYERARDQILVQLEESVADDPDRDHAVLRMWLSRGQVDAFCEHADAVVAAGRPPCTWCGLPFDPVLHICPRMN